MSIDTNDKYYGFLQKLQKRTRLLDRRSKKEMNKDQNLLLLLFDVIFLWCDVIILYRFYVATSIQIWWTGTSSVGRAFSKATFYWRELKLNLILLFLLFYFLAWICGFTICN